MAVTTVDSSKVVFSNSGAAANLSGSATEESGLITFDVLALSGGGTNTTLYSVDDAIKNDDGGAGVPLRNSALRLPSSTADARRLVRGLRASTQTGVPRISGCATGSSTLSAPLDHRAIAPLAAVS